MKSLSSMCVIELMHSRNRKLICTGLSPLNDLQLLQLVPVRSLIHVGGYSFKRKFSNVLPNNNLIIKAHHVSLTGLRVVSLPSRLPRAKRVLFLGMFLLFPRELGHDRCLAPLKFFKVKTTFSELAHSWKSLGLSQLGKAEPKLSEANRVLIWASITN